MSASVTQRKLAAKAAATAESVNGTIVGVVTAIGGMIVGLGIISSSQEGTIVAITTAGIAAAGVLANAIHTGSINPSAIQASVLSVVGQVVVLIVSFGVISDTAAGVVISSISAGVLAVAQIAHALTARALSQELAR